MDGDGEPVVSKGEATRGVALDERRSDKGKRGCLGDFNAEAQRRKGVVLLVPVREKRGKRGGAVRRGVRSSEGGAPAADNARRRWGRVNRRGVLGGGPVRCRMGCAWRAWASRGRREMGWAQGNSDGRRW
jgi:hypothetical protein